MFKCMYVDIKVGGDDLVESLTDPPSTPLPRILNDRELWHVRRYVCVM